MAVAVHTSSASTPSWSPLPVFRRAADTVKHAATEAASVTVQQASKLGHATYATASEAGRSVSKLSRGACETVAEVGKDCGEAAISVGKMGGGAVVSAGKMGGDAVISVGKAGGEAAVCVGKAGQTAVLSVAKLGQTAVHALFSPLTPVPQATKAAGLSLLRAPGGVPSRAATPLTAVEFLGDETVEDLERQVILHQRERRRVWYHNAGEGLRTGVCLGAACGWIPAIALAPTSGASSLLLWPASMAGLGVAGATIGATGNFHFSPSRPDDVRKHIFERFGVVSSRRESAALIARLKDAGALSRTRFRKLLSVDAAPAVFAATELPLAQQRRGVRILQVIAQESARRAPLLVEAGALWKEIEALQKKPQKERTAADQTRIHALIAEAAQLNARLAWLKPEDKDAAQRFAADGGLAAIEANGGQPLDSAQALKIEKAIDNGLTSARYHGDDVNAFSMNGVINSWA